MEKNIKVTVFIDDWTDYFDGKRKYKVYLDIDIFNEFKIHNIWVHGNELELINNLTVEKFAPLWEVGKLFEFLRYLGFERAIVKEKYCWHASPESSRLLELKDEKSEKEYVIDLRKIKLDLDIEITQKGEWRDISIYLR